MGADHRVQAQVGRDLRAALRAQQLHPEHPEEDPQAGQQHPAQQFADHPAVPRVREQAYVHTEPALLQRAGDPVEAAGEPAQHRQQRQQLVARGVPYGLGLQLPGEPGLRVRP